MHGVGAKGKTIVPPKRGKDSRKVTGEPLKTAWSPHHAPSGPAEDQDDDWGIIDGPIMSAMGDLADLAKFRGVR